MSWYQCRFISYFDCQNYFHSVRHRGPQCSPPHGPPNLLHRHPLRQTARLILIQKRSLKERFLLPPLPAKLMVQVLLAFAFLMARLPGILVRKKKPFFSPSSSNGPMRALPFVYNRTGNPGSLPHKKSDRDSNTAWVHTCPFFSDFEMRA